MKEFKGSHDNVTSKLHISKKPEKTTPETEAGNTGYTMVKEMPQKKERSFLRVYVEMGYNEGMET